MGSASELEYHLLLTHDLKYLSESEYAALQGDVTEVKRMLGPFIQKVRVDR